MLLMVHHVRGHPAVRKLVCATTAPHGEGATRVVVWVRG